MSEPNSGAVENLYSLAKAGRWAEVMPTFATQPELAARCSRYVKPSSGWTFLHQAAYFGYECGVRTLIRLGALVTALSKDGETPLSVSGQRGHQNVALILESAAAGEHDCWKPHDNPEAVMVEWPSTRCSRKRLPPPSIQWDANVCRRE
jgi:hypothetical protein